MRTSLSRLFRGPSRWHRLVPILVPALVVGLLTWGFWSPAESQGTAKAAVVNLDKPVKVQGRMVPLGRQLANNLVHGDDRRYDWTLTDEEGAAEGMRDGTYAAVVTVPEQFSKRATSATAGDAEEAAQGTLDVATSPKARIADATISRDVTGAAVAALNDQVVETYLANVYVGFGTMRGQMGKAADGAGRLADGTGQLAKGTAGLATGADRLVVGLGDLSSGAVRLADGTDRLAAGAPRLAAGAERLADGAEKMADGNARLAQGSGQLADGLTKAEKDTGALPEQTEQLAAGARQVADGNRALADAAGPLTSKITSTVDDLPSTSSAASDLAKIAARCHATAGLTNQDLCADLDRAAARAAADAGRIDAVKLRVTTMATGAQSSLDRLADGAEQVADGTERLAARSGELSGGIGDAAAGARRLDAGLNASASGSRQLAVGARSLAQGTSELAGGAAKLGDGARRLAGGTTQAQQGAGALASGAGKLGDGAAQADSGAGELAKGLSTGAGSIPSYSKDESERLAKTAASPVLSPASGDSDYAVMAVPLFLVLALWAGALATSLVVRAVPRSAGTSRLPTWRLLGQGLRPGAALGAFTGLALGAGLSAVLGLPAPSGAAFTGVAVFSALVLTLLAQGLGALLGRAGHVISLTVLVLTAVTGLLSSIPSALASLAPLLPTNGAIVALRSVATGSGDVGSGVAQLTVWLLVALAALAFATERSRSVRPRDLRPVPSVT